jgi:hypothetical protein
MSSSQSPTTIPDEALEFAGFVLAHCATIADANRGGELICPFAVVEGNGRREVINFQSDTQEEAVAKGWSTLAQARTRHLAWAFGREGIYREPDGTGTDVLLVTVWIPRMTDHHTVQQCFGRGQDEAICLLGETKLLRHTERYAEPVDDWNQRALEQGIASHPKGSSWDTWKHTH